MNTRALIDQILPWCQGWSRSSGQKNLLKLVQSAVNKLYSYDGDRFVYRGTDNKGRPPFLLTTAGQYRYDIVATNLSCGAITRTIEGQLFSVVPRLIKRVYTSDGDVRGTSQVGFEGLNTPPYFDFLDDPGTENSKYFIEFIFGPPRLLSENIPVPVPSEFEDDIVKYVIGECQWFESGRPNDNVAYFENTVIPKFQALMTQGATDRVYKTNMRFC